MNFKKTVAIAAAAGALAAISVPALAMENEFHGMYRLRAIDSNFMNAGGGTLKDGASTLNVFEQRARIQYIAKASADLKLVTQFEIDSSWGDAAYNNGRGMGGAFGADTVNLETKNVYLDFNCPLTGANIKAGIQGATDAYKGIVFNNDLAGVFASKKIGGVTATAGFSRLQDFAVPAAATNANATGKKNLDLYLLDGKFAVSKDLTVGGSYYQLRKDDLYSGQNVHMLGANAAAKFGAVSADAFLAYQMGDALDGTAAAKQDLAAYAAQVAVKADLGAAGTVRGNALYISGDNNTSATKTKSKAFQSLNSIASTGAASPESSYYESKMLLLMRSAFAMDSDKALVTNSNNSNLGLTLVSAGYDIKINDKMDASVNLGYAQASEKRGANSASIGTEFNAAVNYKLFANLTATLQGAYVVLGDGMSKSSGTLLTTAVVGVKNADNPYLTEVMLNFTF